MSYIRGDEFVGSAHRRTHREICPEHPFRKVVGIAGDTNVSRYFSSDSPDIALLFHANRGGMMIRPVNSSR